MFESITLPLFIAIGGWSTHFAPTYKECSPDYTVFASGNKVAFGDKCEPTKFNNTHNMIMVDYNGFTAGTLINSYNVRSNILGYTYRKDNFSVLAGMATGYEYQDRCKLKIGNGCAIVSLSYSIRPLKFTFLGDSVAVSLEFKL